MSHVSVALPNVCVVFDADRVKLSDSAPATALIGVMVKAADVCVVLPVTETSTPCTTAPTGKFNGYVEACRFCDVTVVPAACAIASSVEAHVLVLLSNEIDHWSV